MARLRSTPPPRIAIVTAPAGSGKSTVLAQWADGDGRPACWLTCQDADLDPATLLLDLSRVIGQAYGSGPLAETAARLRGGDALRNLSRLVRAMATAPEPGLVIIDDAHRLAASPQSLDVLVSLADRLPPGWSLGIAKRRSLSLPVARWLARDPSLVRLDVDDLALDAEECGRLLRSLGLAPTDQLVCDVLGRTEGWPVGVYLAGLALRSDRPLREGPLAAGDDALIRSYLETEVLSGIATRDRDLLLQTSIVGEVSGPLAEAITGMPDAGDRLYAISRAILLVRPVDRQERWFRYHALLADLLRRELEDRGLDVRTLHERAARWYADNGDIDNAVSHASAAGAPGEVRRLVLTSFAREYRLGRPATVRRWMSVAAASGLAHDRDLALAAGLVAALEGDVAALAVAVDAAQLDEQDRDGDRRPGSGDLDGPVLRALICPQGPEAMRDDARRALDRHGDAWQWASMAWLSLGEAERMLGDDGAALAAFAALERTAEADSALARLVARAEQAEAAMERRAWGEAERLLQLDRHVVLDALDGAHISVILWLVADARYLVHRGDLRTADERLRRTQLGRERLTAAIPWYAVRALSAMAEVQLLRGDVAGARTSVAQARDILRSRPGLGRLEADLERVERRTLVLDSSRPGSSTLSPAELRLLPLLQTYLSFKEIGSRLSISVNTVKTEAMSIYAKLGASTRSEAVERAVEAGLLEDTFA